MSDLKNEIEEVQKQLQVTRVAANQTTTTGDKIALLKQVKKLYTRLAQLQISGVVRATRSARAETARLRTERSHFMFVVMKEMLAKAAHDHGIRNLIVSLVNSIQKPQEKEKATKMLNLVQQEWAKLTTASRGQKANDSKDGGKG